MENNQQYIIQFVSRETGYRTQPLAMTRQELKANLDKYELPAQDYILVVAKVDPNSEENQLELVHSPLFTVQTFLDTFNLANNEAIDNV